MPRRKMLLNTVVIWASVLMLLTATVWTHLFASETPLIGLEELGDPALGVPLTLIALVLAVFLSIPPLWTHARLLVCAGVCLCLFLVVGLYAGSSGGLGLVLGAVNILRESSPSKGAQSAQGTQRAADAAPVAAGPRSSSPQS
jgi:hypothetical protein